MNIKAFLEHHKLGSNPFRAEEARQDVVFERIEQSCHHPDFEKILGDLHSPSSSIVFGERGSGKTAIRLQLEQSIESYNQANPDARCFPIFYDDFNAALSRYGRATGSKDARGIKLKHFTLADHMDAMLAGIVPRLVDQAISGRRARESYISAGLEDFRRRLLHCRPAVRADLLLLAVCYDRPESAPDRLRRLKHLLRLGGISAWNWFRGAFIVSMIIAIAYSFGYGIAALRHGLDSIGLAWCILFWVCASMPVVFVLLWLGTAVNVHLLAGRLNKAIRVLDRGTGSYSRSIRRIRLSDLQAAHLPRNRDEQPRYEAMDRLRRVLEPFGYRSIVVIMDRIDEPASISGDVTRMRQFTWPMLNNRFLQHPGFGIKLLLPLSLRQELLRERPEFFREARLDKQNLVDRLSWSGAVLYDVCTSRLNACRPADDPCSLMDLFDQDVQRSTVIDALDQMHQPRDAFKFMYRLIREHCANVPHEESAWTISRVVLDLVRKQEIDRIDGVLRDQRPG